MLFWSRCHIAPPIPTRVCVHAANDFNVEGAKALVPALQAMTQPQSLNLYGTLPPPTPGDIVCVLAYAFGRGLTVGAGCICVTVWEGVYIYVCVLVYERVNFYVCTAMSNVCL